MENELMTYNKLTRQHWKTLRQGQEAPLTDKELQSIKSLNDSISILDVEEVYLPLVHLIQIYKNTQENLAFSKSLFLQEEPTKRPFIIGVSGSVAVGKSTTSRLLQLLLERSFSGAQVELVTTDGFLYDNATLKAQNNLNRKGFPESYDMEKLLGFLDRISNGQTCHIPVYSHEIYDIVPNQSQKVTPSDFLIVEGINVFQNRHNNSLYMTDYYDFSIYIDAQTPLIEAWYLERFETLLDMAKDDASNYYHLFSQMPRSEALSIAKKTWKGINLINLTDYIEPTKTRAEVILHKRENHQIDKIYLKK
ncbi:type I pantothenate kinase [Streptococcus sp. DD12]|uniref:type I pantothenate kinase n=1 Tax=Streptococcus sp. DD12 TaxID=1777880 RepID=UPI000791314B|nr:type I pantothenate kinase [Streptococcus sp. DD12]KXT76626.1 Pantothenate kinase [Streptococcus sp. DD12]